MSARRLLLVAATTGYQTRMFAEAARRLGIDAELATDRCHVLDDPWGDRAVPVRFEAPEESAKQLVAHGPYDGIVAVGDRPAYLAALAAARLGLQFHTTEGAEAATNKFAAHERFRLAGLPVPDYFRTRVDSNPAKIASRAQYPCVLKPLGLSASRGVIRADDPGQFVAAFERIAALLATPEIRRLHSETDQYIQVERFIPGREFALEGLVGGGKLQVLALFDKPDPLDGPYFEETIYVTPSRVSAASQARIVESVERAVHALGLCHGPVHAEMRVDGGTVWILEVAPRPIGGLCGKALVFEPDVSLEELIVRHALGEDVSGVRRRDAASGVMMIPVPRGGIYQHVQGVDKAAAIPGISEVIITAKEGQRIEPLPEGNTYLGFLFASGDFPEQVESSLRAAHQELEFEIATTLPVV